MMAHLNSTRYHPNSYIASRRSSLPRQGYGGVYERRISLGVTLTPSPSSTQLRKNHSALPRNLSDFTLRTVGSSSPSQESPTGKKLMCEAQNDLTSPSDYSPCPKSAPVTGENFSFNETNNSTTDVQLSLANDESTTSRTEVSDRSPSPPLTLPDVTIRWRSRSDEENEILRRLLAAQRAQGRIAYLPSVYFARLVADYSGMQVINMDEFEDEEVSSCSESDGDRTSPVTWNCLITSLLNRKKELKSFLDKEYRDSKRQASQMRQAFEKQSDQVVSRFDRLISDILCYARLVCHLARQSARFGNDSSPRACDLTTLIEDKRNILKKQLSELPRLRQSLLRRQASLINMCSDTSTQIDLLDKFSSYWSFALQLCVIDSEIVLDNELIQR